MRIAHLTEGCEKGDVCPHHHTKSKRSCLALQTKSGCSKPKCPFAAGHEVIGKMTTLAIEDWANEKSVAFKENSKGGSAKGGEKRIRVSTMRSSTRRANGSRRVSVTKVTHAPTFTTVPAHRECGTGRPRVPRASSGPREIHLRISGVRRTKRRRKQIAETGTKRPMH